MSDQPDDKRTAEFPVALVLACRLAIQAVLDRVKKEPAAKELFTFTESLQLLIQAESLLTGRPDWRIEAEVYGLDIPEHDPEDAAIDFKPFCATDEARGILTRPFVTGYYRCACDGHIMACIPRHDADNEDEGAPDIERVLADFDKAAEFFPFATEIDDPASDYQVGPRWVRGYYLKLISMLPNARCAFQAGDKNSALSFRFGKSGIGMLMPLREAKNPIVLEVSK